LNGKTNSDTGSTTRANKIRQMLIGLLSVVLSQQKKRPRLVESDGRLMELVNLLQNSNPPGVNDDIACIFHQE
jgi:hypothetical protein